MQYSRGIQISDLEDIQSDLNQELTIEEAKKVVGGSLPSAGTISDCKKRKCHLTEIIVIGTPNIIPMRIELDSAVTIESIQVQAVRLT